ncbi:catechol o methyltransferase [Hyphopichia burtonii NRRL Y-1933]|uniref:catechol O-methyltransferase n=1 Tax=Hyphopichia burtonii NRRL Y-1933 TaxID=984485 RepID=A0A1E4RNS5_9ASCO|nr:catechol o methyltransferase [Hyphopichia burtonii NRRL Y-1933]ODV68851.1 catechol o methyltransferase [Hyphopichia burtonii NRRL Y-1933]
MGKDTTFFDDGREEQLIDFIFSLPENELNQLKGNPIKVLEKIDEFSLTQSFLMNIGKVKGKMITDIIEKEKPKILVEIGGYIGYSAILFANSIKEDSNATFYTFEYSEKFADIARKLIDLAGLSHKIRIIVGKAHHNLVSFESELTRKTGDYVSVDFVFIDHWWVQYVPDFRVLESLNLIRPGTVIVADNIWNPPPGAPDYLRYVKGSPQDRKIHNEAVENINGKHFTGRWNIIYDSKTVEVKPISDAIEVTKCLQYLTG